MEEPMSSRYRVVIPSNTAHLAKRLAQPFSKRKLLHAARMMGPTLVALTFAGVAHAQGTMDFSGAQTLMGSFNTGLPYAWNPERPSRLGLLPRNGDAKQMRWVEAPSCYVFHVMNAFDDGNAVVMDVVRHPRTLDKEHYGPGEGLSKLVRWCISLLTGKLTETVLEERGCEFPRFNDEFGGKEYRFGYTAASDEEFQFGPAFKHDVSTGRTEVHDYGPGCATLEPVFIARKGAIEEDDGWVMSYVYNAERNASDVVILDAKAFSEEPVASISLPVRVPFGFHGNWVPDHI
jgi:carotenoid cleavage dioxygenase-like enzyme